MNLVSMAWRIGAVEGLLSSSALMVVSFASLLPFGVPGLEFAGVPAQLLHPELDGALCVVDDSTNFLVKGYP